MERFIFTFLAIALWAITLQGQTTAYRKIADNTEIWDGALWQESDSSRSYYAEANQDTLIHYYKWNTINNSWDELNRQYNTFDSNNNVIQRLVVTWDGTLFINYTKDELEYNTNNDLTLYTHYTWDGAQWIGNVKHIYEYNAQGLVTTFTRQNYISNTWVNDYRILYTYNGNLEQATETQTWSGTAWVKVSRTVYTRDIIGNITIFLFQNWDGSSFVNNTQNIRVYDAQNQLLRDTQCDWISGNWDTVNRSSFTYNLAGMLTVLLRQSYNGTTWSNTNREINTYRSNQLQIDTTVFQRWVSSNWSNLNMRSFGYDVHENHTSTHYYTWDNPTWVGTSRNFLYYEAYQTTGIRPMFETLAITPYPNPFANELQFKLPEVQAGEVKIELLDLAGRTILQENQLVMPGQTQVAVPTSHLPSGGYIYLLTINGKQARGLVAK